uniref:Uncharacterized protein n=1 Tax=Eutreptiella gymnastica TaxID=73025 RepID=A0A7S4CW83_9EUGL
MDRGLGSMFFVCVCAYRRCGCMCMSIFVLVLSAAYCVLEPKQIAVSHLRVSAIFCRESILQSTKMQGCRKVVRFGIRHPPLHRGDVVFMPLCRIQQLFHWSQTCAFKNCRLSL